MKFLHLLIKLALPIILQHFLTSSMVLIDTLMIGQLNEAAIAADSAYSILVDELGFQPPMPDNGIDGDELDIYIKNWNGTYYGMTYFGNTAPSPTYLVVDNNYTEPGYATSGLEALRVTIAHEFFHMLGLSDIYINDQNQESFVGIYSLMDKGCWNGNEDKYDGSIPSHITALEKSMLGWLELKEIIEEKEYSLKNMSETNEAYILKIEEGIEEYIIIENRQKKGYDIEIKGEGILMYRLYKEEIEGENFEESLYSNALNNRNPKRYFLMEANGAKNIKYNNGDELDFFSKDTFSKLSDIGWDKPNSCIWSEEGYIENTGIVIKNISESGDNMTFEYRKNNLDINKDDIVNHYDLQYLKNNFNNYSYFYDYYGDGVIDFKDLIRFIERYKKEYEGVLLW